MSENDELCEHFIPSGFSHSVVKQPSKLENEMLEMDSQMSE